MIFKGIFHVRYIAPTPTAQPIKSRAYSSASQNLKKNTTRWAHKQVPKHIPTTAGEKPAEPGQNLSNVRTIATMKYLLLLLLPLFAHAQTSDDFATGMLLEDEQYNALARQSPEDGSKAELPATVDLTPYCPEIRHQGYIFSCVGWATGYGALSIQRAILNQCTDKQVITRNAHSALFLYNQIKAADCDKGSRITDALQFLATNGDCLARQFDFDVNDCASRPDSLVRRAAKRFAIQDYLTLFHANERPEEKVLRVKKALAKNKPVVMGMVVLLNFYELKNAQYWHPSIGNTAPAGGHALVVVGYDDQKSAFRLMNSWGKNWGDNGYIWIKYKDFGDFCKYAYVLYLSAPEKLQTTETPLEAPETPLQSLAGSCRFLSLNGWMEQTGQPLLEEVTARREGQVYQLAQSEWPTGQRFQLHVASALQEQYLYVFSIDARREVHFHWPRQAGLNEKFEGQNESALLLHQGDIVIPGPAKVLKLTMPGTDRLVILFSSRKIETVQQLATRLAQSTGDMATNLRQILGKYAIPEADITYAPGAIGFTASTRAEGFIVPLLLEVQAR